ncbi:MAG: YbjN domain-containing protein [Ignavibacteriaceae bacterium]|nr:YbjN domain-containing protein [Ignavibacteriaceae bacterium]
MQEKFDLVKSYIENLGYTITSSDDVNHLLVVNNEEKGISNLIVDCEDPIVIFEQFIGEIKEESIEKYRELLRINRELVAGAFVLDGQKNRLFFKNTLELSNLDENEVEGTLNALNLTMAEYGDTLINICK